MYISKSFIPILKNNPSEAKIKSHQLMLRVGMIKQSSAGIYSWLPLGFKVMKKIEQIVREEQNKIGAQEMLMPTIQSSEIWKESGRYDDYGDEMLRIKDRQDREMLYGPTNEELVTDIFRSSIKSYNSSTQFIISACDPMAVFMSSLFSSFCSTAISASTPSIIFCTKFTSVNPIRC